MLRCDVRIFTLTSTCSIVTSIRLGLCASYAQATKKHHSLAVKKKKKTENKVKNEIDLK